MTTYSTNQSVRRSMDLFCTQSLSSIMLLINIYSRRRRKRKRKRARIATYNFSLFFREERGPTKCVGGDHPQEKRVWLSYLAVSDKECSSMLCFAPARRAFCRYDSIDESARPIVLATMLAFLLLVLFFSDDCHVRYQEVAKCEVSCKTGKTPVKIMTKKGFSLVFSSVLVLNWIYICVLC